MAKREGNRPDRRLARPAKIDQAALRLLAARVQYVGSALHKLRPGNYGFVPSHNPRPSKSTCDEIRPVLMDEASQLFQRGIELGMVSEFGVGAVPKYIWAVDRDDQVYEAKTKPEREICYHGYRLGEDEVEMQDYILGEWKKRCPAG